MKRLKTLNENKMKKSQIQKELEGLEGKLVFNLQIASAKQSLQNSEATIASVFGEYYQSLKPFSKKHCLERLQQMSHTVETYLILRHLHPFFTERYKKKIDTMIDQKLSELHFKLTRSYLQDLIGIEIDGEKTLALLRSIIIDQGISINSKKSVENLVLNLLLSTLCSEDFVQYYQGRGFPAVNCAQTYTPENLVAAQKIRPLYDVGVCIAKGGLYVAYLLHFAGLPIMDVEMKRKGTGARWIPQPSFAGEKLTGQKVLIAENDTVTGRTLRRAVQEIKKYSPLEMGVCFMDEQRDIFGRVPPEIQNIYHLTGRIVLNLEEEFAFQTSLAQKFDSKYHIFQKNE